MQLTKKIRLVPNAWTIAQLNKAMLEFADSINATVRDAESGVDISKYTSKNIVAALPSTVRCEIARQAKSMYKAHGKRLREAERKHWNEPELPQVKRKYFSVNNQNFKINPDSIEIPIWLDGKSKRIQIPARLTEEQYTVLSNAHFGTLRIGYRHRKLFAWVPYEAAEAEPVSSGVVMGIDLGVKCPAVSCCSDGSVQFFGSGKKNRKLRSKIYQRRKSAQKAKKRKVVKRIGDKENRIMRDIDHKLSREVVNYAIKHNVAIIRLEKLRGVSAATSSKRCKNVKMKTARRKRNRMLARWSFYRLQSYIEYKAKLAGIAVEYINPAYTSQLCPKCGAKNVADDRNYTCTCGYHGHRDVVAAMNILKVAA